jgi:ABC-type transport system involved in cytochrome c biogenesis permease subunit
MNGWARWVPGIAISLVSVWLVSESLPPHDSPGEMKVLDYGRLPALANGRIKPLDTVARTNLMILSDRQTFAVNQKASEDGKAQPAIKWFLDVMAHDKSLLDSQFVRIEDDQVLKLLDLPMRPRWWRYSLEEIFKNIGKIRAEVERARNRPPDQRDAYDAHILKLEEHLGLLSVLANGVDPPQGSGRGQRGVAPRVLPPLTDNGSWQTFAAVSELVEQQVSEWFSEQLKSKGTSLDKLTADERATWSGPLRQRIADGLREAHPAAPAYARLLDAYRNGKVADFNDALAEFERISSPYVAAGDYRGVWVESIFNNFAPFYRCTILYVVVFLLAALTFLVPSEALWRTAFCIGWLTFSVHALALLARMYIQWRPPVTNLYSSAVFIGCGCVLVGLILEAIYKNGLGVFAAGALGFATSVVAHFLGTDGDTLEMLQAVLDTDFWLATHVTTVNLGYTATLVPGFLGAVYIIRGVFTRSLTSQATKTISQMMYGVICFATFLSFTGTVLGGIWADQSWGRFWGWDPKENGALLIVIWNAMILHARWGGMIKSRGMAILAVLGNIVTIWSWFGTNQLGVGLHAYGFRSGMAKWIVISSATHLAIAGLGMLPLKYWRSKT